MQGDSIVMKTRYSREGCKITTVMRKAGDVLAEEIILEAENLRPQQDLPILLEEEDTGKWLIAGT